MARRALARLQGGRPGDWDGLDSALSSRAPPADEGCVRLSRLLHSTGQSFEYVYDFGDDWTHSVEVVEILRDAADTPLPTCEAGKGACPEEDSRFAEWSTRRREPFRPEAAEATFARWRADGPGPGDVEIRRLERLAWIDGGEDVESCLRCGGDLSDSGDLVDLVWRDGSTTPRWFDLETCDACGVGHGGLDDLDAAASRKKGSLGDLVAFRSDAGDLEAVVHHAAPRRAARPEDGGSRLIALEDFRDEIARANAPPPTSEEVQALPFDDGPWAIGFRAVAWTREHPDAPARARVRARRGGTWRAPRDDHRDGKPSTARGRRGTRPPGRRTPRAAALARAAGARRAHAAPRRGRSQARRGARSARRHGRRRSGAFRGGRPRRRRGRARAGGRAGSLARAPGPGRAAGVLRRREGFPPRRAMAADRPRRRPRDARRARAGAVRGPHGERRHGGTGPRRVRRPEPRRARGERIVHVDGVPVLVRWPARGV